MRAALYAARYSTESQSADSMENSKWHELQFGSSWRVGRRRVGWPEKRQRAIKTKVRGTRFKGRRTAGRVLLVDRRLPQWSIAAPSPRARPAGLPLRGLHSCSASTNSIRLRLGCSPSPHRAHRRCLVGRKSDCRPGVPL